MTIESSEPAELLEGGIDDPLVFHPADPHAGDRPIPGDRRQRQSRGCPQHAQNVRIVLLVRRDHEAGDLRLVTVVVGEQGPERSIDLPGRHRFLVAGPRLPLDEAAGELPRRVRLLPVLDGERKERKVAALPFRDRCHQHRGITELDVDRRVRLPGHPAGLHDEFPAGEFLL
jgi:hypothetical protein